VKSLARRHDIKIPVRRHDIKTLVPHQNLENPVLLREGLWRLRVVDQVQLLCFLRRTVVRTHFVEPEVQRLKKNFYLLVLQEFEFHTLFFLWELDRTVFSRQVWLRFATVI
jgi:hypothetical protein